MRTAGFLDQRLNGLYLQTDNWPERLQTFRMVEYEDELDLLAAVVTDGGEGEGRARIQLYDNQSGQLLRRAALHEPWDEVRRRASRGPAPQSVT